MVSAYFERFYREILIIINIIFAYSWKLISIYDPKWWSVGLFVITIIIEFFTLIFILDHIGETDFTWRQKWKNFCRFDKRNCKNCEFGRCCKYSNCQHKSLRNGRYYLLKILGHWLIIFCLTSCTTTKYNIGVVLTGETEWQYLEDKNFNEELFNDCGFKLVIEKDIVYIDY